MLLLIDHVVRTKILPPRRRVGMLRRQRLVDILHENINRKVILISAPAGYGKTSLLVDFLQDAPLRSTWYGMGEEDADPWTFVSHVAASVMAAFPEVQDRLRAAFSGTVAQDSTPQTALQILVNELQAGIHDYFLLVIDDFHHSDRSEAVGTLVNWFVEHLPDNCCLVLASRTLPGLPYLKLVAKQEIAGLGGQDLAFTPDEIQAYLAGNHQMTVSLEEAERLAKDSEGWITGILLGTHALWRGLLRSISEAKGTESQVFGYLAQEVFALQAEPIQRFLTATSILHVLRPASCDALLEIDDSAETLESLERANLFVSRLSGDEKVYRYHALFQDFLLDRLEAGSAQVARDLRLRAAQLEEAGGEAEQALEHYLLVAAESESVRLLESLMESAYQSGRFMTLERWLDSLGPESVGRHGALLVMRGRLFRQKGEFDDALLSYAQARDRFLLAGDRVGEAGARVRQALVHRYRGEVDEARLICEDVLAHYPELASDPRTQAQAERILGEVHHIAGRLPESKRAFRRSLKLFEKAGDQYQSAALLQSLGTTARRMGNPLEAEGHYNRALKILQNLGNRWRVAEIENNIGVGHYYQGEYEQALKMLENALTESRQVGHRRTEALVLASLGDVHADMGNDRQAQQLYQESLEGARSTKDFVLEVHVLCAQANLYRLDRAWEQAHALLDEAAARPIPEGHGYLRGLLSFYRGIVLLDQGDAAQAMLELKSADLSLEAAGAKRELARTYLWEAYSRFCGGDRKAAFELLGRGIDLCLEIVHPSLFIADGKRMLPFLEEARRHDEQHRDWIDRLLVRIHQVSVATLRLPEAQVSRQVLTPKVEVRALGRGSVSVDGETIAHTAWGGPLVKELFFYLVDHKSVQRESILGTFWPDLSNAKAKSVFHATVYRMRRVLPSGLIGYNSAEETYVIERMEDTWYDVAVFEELVRQARAQEGQRAELLEQAVSIYRSPYLSDVYSDWAADRREQIQRTYIEALVSLARIRCGSGETGAGIELFRKAVAEEPFREDLHRELMQALVAAGRPAEAVKHHELLTELLRRELNTGPSEETERVVRSIQSGPQASQ